MIGLTVVGKPAATVMTSSPGLSRRSPSFGEVRAVRASRLADEPELTSVAVRIPKYLREGLFELCGEAAGGQPEIERRFHERLDVFGVEDAAGDRHRSFARHERARREGGVVIVGNQSRGSAPRRSSAVTHAQKLPDTRRWFWSRPSSRVNSGLQPSSVRARQALRY